MNVYSVTLGHARPELERSISFLSWHSAQKLGEYPSFDKWTKSIATKEGRDYFVKNVVREPFPIRRFK